jgi:hypothetical protein
MSLTRREAIVLVAAAAAGVCLPGSAAGQPASKGERKDDKLKHERRPPHVAYRRSGRGRRVSRAVKIRNASFRYKNKPAALKDRAHPGDTSRVVPIAISKETFFLWFGNGAHKVDLRRLGQR